MARCSAVQRALDGWQVTLEGWERHDYDVYAVRFILAVTLSARIRRALALA